MKNNHKPKISIITVVYNSVSTIEKSIISVLDQNYDNLEYIIIDGGSTDGTINIVNKYKDEIDYFVSEKDGGIYDAMNKGLIQASGDMVAFLNSDDWYEADSLLKVSNAVINNPSAMLVCGQVRVVQEKGNKSLESIRLNEIDLSG